MSKSRNSRDSLLVCLADEVTPGHPVLFRLRSGYEVCFAGDAPGMIEHLQEAIIEESLARLAISGDSSWDALVAEIVAECKFVVASIPVEMARPLLVGLLSDAIVGPSTARNGRWGRIPPSTVQ